MATRKIVQIDEDKCNGCGECIPNCPEGALRIVDGKARLVSDTHCDGLGACLGTCPQDAISIVEREAEEFDEEAVAERMGHEEAGHPHHGACPGAALMEFPEAAAHTRHKHNGPHETALSQWPVQLDLVPADAPLFDGADLLLAADCVPFAMADFHDRLLAGRKVLVGCPKLDDAARYEEKLTAILRQHHVKSLTVAHVEVPCCFGLMELAKRAVQASDSDVPVEEIVVSIRGEIKERNVLEAPALQQS